MIRAVIVSVLLGSVLLCGNAHAQFFAGPSVSFGYSSSSYCGPGYYTGVGVSYVYAPDYVYAPAPVYRPNYAVTGTILGGLTGAIIGSSMRGPVLPAAIIGAGAGLIIGGVAEENARARERAYAPAQLAATGYTEVQTDPPQPAPAPAAAPVPGVSAAKPAVRAKFVTPIYRAIPDAPSVPDAPTIPDAPRLGH